jgi:hypothetical protein
MLDTFFTLWLRDPPKLVWRDSYHNSTSPLEILNEFSSTVMKPCNESSADDRDGHVARRLPRKCSFIILACLLFIILFSQITNPAETTNITPTDQNQLLQLAENATKSCSFSNMKSEKGRGECQEICKYHSCCFWDDEGKNGCRNDPDMMCSVFVACKSLFNPDDDEQYNHEDINVGDAAAGLYIPEDTASASDQTSTEEGNELNQNDSTMQQTENDYNQSNSEFNFISHVISTVCENDNLHTHQGLHECVALCSSSICCFNHTIIYALNPHVDTILKLEGVALDLTSLSKCINDESNHFCQAHSGCKNLLLIGSSNKGNLVYYNETTVRDQENVVVNVLIPFGIALGIVAYLLMYTRLPLPETREPSEQDSLVETSSCDREML